MVIYTMKVNQISVFLENRKGRLAEVTRVLGNNNLNIRSILLADTSDFGMLRMIIDRPDVAYMVLKEQHYTLQEDDVFAVEVVDHPGALAEMLKGFADAGVNVEYLYPFHGRTAEGNVILVFKFDDPDQAEIVMQQQGIHTLDVNKI